MSDYARLLASKRFVVLASGVSVDEADVHPALFPFQRALVRWACRKGRAALFADTGLGKTLMQLEWARLVGERTLIVAPLGVAHQTVREARRIDLDVTYARSQAEATGALTITNYEMLSHFDAAAFDAVVLDESSILKALDGKTRTRLTEMFADTPYRLCCTATPAPNDITEIANHAEFLGVMRRVDMLASFFVHDDEGWRLKGHAQEPFYRWLASWAMAVRKPSDLGAFSDDGYDLPALSIEPVWVDADYVPDGQLFFTELKGIGDRAAVRRGTLDKRVAAAAALVNADDEPWIVWCGLNEESSALAAAIPGAVEIMGSDSPDDKAAKIEAFSTGQYRVVVTKPRIAGFGVNWQHCNRMVFVGLSDSFEMYYQCVRRCWRFGQRRPVRAYIVLSQVEDAIYHNVMCKEREAAMMSENLVAAARDYEQEELAGDSDDEHYAMATERGENWTLLLGDAVERLAELPDESVDLSVFSPPFMSLYTYSPTERDLGNCATPETFFQHFGYIIDHLLRVTKPGRNCCVHVAQVPAMLERDGYIGIKDFRGQTIEAFRAHGWIQHGEVCIDKDPQAQAIRTKSKALLFVQMRKDSIWSRPALADYILVFRKPGPNAAPVKPDISNEDWIAWARPIWYGISESDTLQYQAAREADDERHICPLQLGVIERCVRLWSNPGETVLSPFAGIGSEVYTAVKHGRRGIGVELKPAYYQAAVRHLRVLEAEMHQPTLFDLAEVAP